MREQDRVAAAVVVDLPQVQQERPDGDRQLRASVRSAAIGSRVTTPCWIRRGADSNRSYTEPSSSRRARPRRPTMQHDVAGEHHGPIVGGPHTLEDHDRIARREVERLGFVGTRRGARDLAVDGPGFMPDARIASVTPKLTSRLFRSRGRCVA